MSGLSAFLSQNAIEMANEKFVISERFLDENGDPIEWEIRSMTEEENTILRKSFTKREKNKNGSITTYTDSEGYVAKLVTECVVYPNLKDKELQDSYGVLGAEALAKAMLKSGEYADLVEKVQKVNGFEEENKIMDELVEEAKN